MSNRLPIATIVGRQNVGKSTLFNALIKNKKAIVDPRPGLTRDVISCTVDHKSAKFTLSDTPGLDLRDTSELSKSILDSATRQLEKSSLIILLMESPSPTSFDMDLVDIIRKLSKPTIIAINKMDNSSNLEAMINFYEVGFNDILPISAKGRINLDLLIDKMVYLLPEKKQTLKSADIKISIVGRPNSGKSTLLNSLTGYNRAVVSHIPGTTRDAVDEEFNFYGKRIKVIDTAGLRKKSRIRDSIDYYSLTRTIGAIKNSDVTIHLIDATIGLTETDKKISDEIVKSTNPAIIAINKWDAIQKNSKTFEQYRDKIIFKFYKAEDFPIISVSAKDKVRIHKLIHTALELKEKASRRVETSKLNKIIESMQKTKRPPQMGEKLKVLYATQVDSNPPTFKLFVNNPSLFNRSITRFLEKYIKRALELEGIPIVLKIDKKTKEQ
jgi:GTP-binding protein